MPPMIIFKKSFPGGNYTVGGPDGAVYAKQDSGFMDSELFLKWFQRIFLVHARPSAENPVLLLLDGHASHCSPQIIEAARDNNVLLLALAPHTTHLCQPLDVAVYKALKVNISKQVKLGQALKGELWIPKRNIARILKDPFEQSMSLANIKAGFRKCGIFPFNPNAIDKEKLLRNRLIPDLTVDLSLSPETEDVATAAQGEQHQDTTAEPVASALQSAQTVQDKVLASSEPQSSIVIDISSTNTCIISQSRIEAEKNESRTVQEDKEELPDLNSTVLPEKSTATASAPVKIKVYTGTARSPITDQPDVNLTISSEIINGSIELLQMDIDANEPLQLSSNAASKNPLVQHGIISPELADVFYAPDENIPKGRKRPLRIQSKARLMTADDVYEDLRKQQENLEEKERKKAQRTATVKSGTKRKSTVSTRSDDADVPSTSGLSGAKGKPSKVKKRGLEENNCFICERSWTKERKTLKTKWVGCEGEGYPHWTCPRCLPTSFDYKNHYRCVDCSC